jgi:hypothetical protein
VVLTTDTWKGGGPRPEATLPDARGNLSVLEGVMFGFGVNEVSRMWIAHGAKVIGAKQGSGDGKLVLKFLKKEKNKEQDV